MIVILRLANSSPVKQHFIKLSNLLSKFILNNFSAVLIAVLPLTGILLMVPELFLHVDTGVIPKIPYLGFFGYFFFLGWLINRHAAISFSWMAEKTWLFLAVGIVLSVFLFWFEFTGRYKANQNLKVAGIKLLAAIQIITLVFGSVGFFLKMWQTESKTWKYVSDASYWMYLIHLSLVAAGQVLLINVQLNGILKFLIIFVTTMAITLATYHFFIRFSIVGEWLHGKRERLRNSREKSRVLLPKKIL